MRATIVAPEASARSTVQKRIFSSLGHPCQLYVAHQLLDQEDRGNALSPAAFLGEDHVQATALFLFQFEDKAYPLLETIRRLQHGFVVLDLHRATDYQQAPVHHVDLCIVADAAQTRSLAERNGLAPEQVLVLPHVQDCEEAWEMFFRRAMQGTLCGTTKAMADVTMMTPSVQELGSILLLRDSDLDRSMILRRVQQAILDCQAAGGYGPDVTTLGPEILRPTSTEDDRDPEEHDSLLQVQQTVDELLAKSRLQEPGFDSSVPLLGPLVVAVRRLWNWISTKWYVRGWMSQQVAFNAEVVSAVGEVLWIQESNRQRLQELEAEIERLRLEEGNEA